MNLSTKKKINAGIVGSSYSTGRKEQNYTFADLLNNHTDCKWHSLACGGKGSEKFLQSVVHLKKKFDIKILLMECVYNRASINAPLSREFNQGLRTRELQNILQNYYTEKNYELWEAHLQHDDGVFEQWQERPFERDLTWDQQRVMFGLTCDLNEVQKWQKVQLEMASNFKMRETMAVIDMSSVLDLCELLDINLISWRHNPWNMFEYQAWRDLKPNLNLIQFGEHETAVEYYIEKYDENKIYLDGVHFTRDIDVEMIESWIAPAVQSMCKLNK